MISFEEAITIAERYLNKEAERSRNNLQLMKDKTMTFELGWVFFYQSKEFIEMGNIYDMLGGNSPFIVNRNDASIHVTGTAHPIQKYLEEYISKYK